MSNWRERVAQGDFTEAEETMLAETEGVGGRGPDAETRAWFYEAWGDMLRSDASAAEPKYRESHRYWSIFASWSTSGGEGAARMLNVNRISEKIEHLHAR